MTVTTEWIIEQRIAVADRLAAAVERGVDDPITHRLDEYRACIAELDEWAAA